MKKELGGIVFCPKCGKQLADTVKFCGSCGAKTNSNVQRPAGFSSQATTSSAQPINSTMQPRSTAYATGAPIPGKSFATLDIVLLAGAVLTFIFMLTPFINYPILSDLDSMTSLFGFSGLTQSHFSFWQLSNLITSLLRLSGSGAGGYLAFMYFFDAVWLAILALLIIGSFVLVTKKRRKILTVAFIVAGVFAAIFIFLVVAMNSYLVSDTTNFLGSSAKGVTYISPGIGPIVMLIVCLVCIIFPVVKRRGIVKK